MMILETSVEVKHRAMTSYYCRNSFGLYIEELFYMKSRQTVESISNFLEVESLSVVQLEKSRLERELTKAYAWISKLDKERPRKITRPCSLFIV